MLRFCFEYRRVKVRAYKNMGQCTYGGKSRVKVVGSDSAQTAHELGGAVRAMRKTYNLTQQQLGDLAGLSDKTVRDIEKGTGSPSLHAVLSVLSVLGLDLEVKS